MKNEDPVVPKKFTIDSFLNNPTGDVGQAIAGRTVIADNLRKRLHTMKRDGKKLVHNYFKVNDDLFIRVKVPSETFEDFTYDVVIKFVGAGALSGSSIATHNIEMYSNAPSFMYSYAYVFNMFGVLPEEMKGKLPKNALEELPSTRNPDAVIFYEKTITMALMYIREENLAATAAIRNSVISLPKSKFIKDVCDSSEEKQEAYNEKRKVESAKKAAEKKAKKAASAKVSVAKKAPTSKVNNVVDFKIAKKTPTAKAVKTSASRKVVSRVDNKVSSKVNSTVKGRNLKKA